LAYYLSPPQDFASLIKDPFHSIVYIAFVIGICGLFAKYWVDYSGESAKDVAKKFVD